MAKREPKMTIEEIEDALVKMIKRNTQGTARGEPESGVSASRDKIMSVANDLKNFTRKTNAEISNENVQQALDNLAQMRKLKITRYGNYVLDAAGEEHWERIRDKGALGFGKN